MKKKYFSFIFILNILCIMIYHTIASAETETKLEIGASSYIANDIISVPINISDNCGFKSLNFDIAFDSSIIEFVSVEFSEYFLKESLFYGIDDTVNENILSIYIRDMEHLFSIDGCLCYFNFKVLDKNNVSPLPLSFGSNEALLINSLQGSEKVILSNTDVSISESYNISFDTNGGNIIPSKQYKYGDTINEHTNRDEYDFIGWYKDDELTEKWNETDIVTSDMTLYAMWTPKAKVIDNIDAYIYEDVYHVEFTINSNENINDNTIIVQFNSESGQVAAIKTCSVDMECKKEKKVSFDFYKSDFKCALGEVPYVSIMMWNPFSKGSNLTKMKSSTFIEVHKVTFNPNYPGATNEVKYIKNGTGYILPTPYRQGYHFISWLLSDGSEWNNNNSFTKDEILYGKFEIDTYTVNFYGANGERLSKKVKYNEIVSEPTMSLEGYILEGWYTANGEKWNFADNKVTENIDLYSKWSVNYYTVTFDTSGGTNQESQTVMYSSLVKKPETETTRNEYNFGGWYSTPECKAEDAWDFSTNKITADTTIYAKWIINQYVVTFESSGGTTIESQTLDYGSTVEPVESTYNGKSLFGWYTDDGHKWDFELDVIKENTTLHAEWYNSTLDEYMITKTATSTIKYNNHFYSYYAVILSWEDARDFCRLLGGYLATMTSAEENSTVNTLCEGNATWFGATNNGIEGSWGWITGETWNYTNWADSEPNNTGGIEYYAHISSSVGKWNDNSAEKRYGFVCEFDSIDTMIPVITCVEIVDKDLTGYTIKCKVTDNHNIVTKVQMPTWTMYSGQDDMVEDWTYNTEATSLKNDNIYTYRVNVTDHNNEIGAYKTHIYAFDSQGNSTCYTLNINLLNEPIATTFYDHAIYELYADKVSWTSAKYSCSNMGGTLTSVVTANENNAIFDLIQNGNSNVWIGASDLALEGTWVWNDKEPLSYSNWASGEPNDSGSSEDCAMMYLNDGTWNDSNDKGAYGFVCKYVDPDTTTRVIVEDKLYVAYDYELSDEDIEAFCNQRGGTVIEVNQELSPGAYFAYEIDLSNLTPAAETVYGDSTYYLYNSSYTWNDAKLICEYLGGHFATITSAEENTLLASMMSQTGVSTCFVGGSDKSAEGTWCWVTGENWSYSNWNSGEPNDYGYEDYLCISSSGKWNDLDGGDKYGFICEIND